MTPKGLTGVRLSFYYFDTAIPASPGWINPVQLECLSVLNEETLATMTNTFDNTAHSFPMLSVEALFPCETLPVEMSVGTAQGLVADTSSIHALSTFLKTTVD
jgi:hypothetical protein